MIGKTLGHYQITEQIGAGGMGVVYKARDLHLDRDVALKILPPEKVADLDRKRRFVQEAKAASALNHPNIVTIHDITQEGATDFIVMEYVDGKTLDQRIGRRGLRLNDALKYAVQIADALAKAHSAGIVHRDLKPTNVMVNEDGIVKVLDFGLAKLTEQIQDDEAASTATVDSGGRPITEEGVIVGTVSYMSPEQAEGKRVDARSDIFSFGSVLYEMVTGQKAFQGTSKMSTLSAILHQEPKAVSGITPAIPAELERLINRCLRKDPAKRFQHMDDIKVALEELKEESDSGRLQAAGSARPKRHRALLWASGMAAILVVAAIGLWFIRLRTGAPETALVAVPVTNYPGHLLNPALSPDGNDVVFAWNGAKQDNYDLYRKLIGPGPAIRLTTDDADDVSPAWAPDGRHIAFIRQPRSGRRRVILIPALGGPEQQVAEVSGAWSSIWTPESLLTWTPDGKRLIVVDRPERDQPTGMFLLSVDTGEKRRLTSGPDRNPSLSPDGGTLLFSRLFDLGKQDFFRLSLTQDLQPQGEPVRVTSEIRQVEGPVWTKDGKEILFSSGHWQSERSMRRLPVGKPGGRDQYQPKPVPFGENAVGIAHSPKSRRLCYVRQSWDSNIHRLQLSGKTSVIGKSEPVLVSTRHDYLPDFSPDGKRVTFVSTRSGSEEVWVCDADSSNARQLTSMGGDLTANPRWSPDGKSILFDSRRDGSSDLYLVSVNGGAPRRITSAPGYEGQGSWSRDGKWIYFCGTAQGGGLQIHRIPADGGDPVQLTRRGGRFALESTDGRWLYYASLQGRVWRMPAHGGEEREVCCSIGEVFNFQVTEQGIYFIPGQEGKFENLTLAFFDFATRETTTILETERPWYLGLALSPDRRWLLFSQLDSFSSELMLVENFR